MGFAYSIVYFRSCSDNLISALKKHGFKEKRVREFQYLSKAQDTFGEMHEIPVSPLSPKVLTKILSGENPNILRESIFIFEFGHVFLIRSQQFTSSSFNMGVIPQLEASCEKAGRSCRDNLCTTDNCHICSYYLLERLQPLVFLNSSTYSSFDSSWGGNERNRLELPQGIVWKVMERGQLIIGSAKRSYMSALSMMIILANTLRQLSKAMMTTVENNLLSQTTQDSSKLTKTTVENNLLSQTTKDSSKLIKMISLLYFWSNPEFIGKYDGARLHMKVWQRDVLVFRLKMGKQDHWNFERISDKLYHLDLIQFSQLVRMTKRMDIKEIQKWRNGINPFKTQSVDLISAYENLSEFDKNLLHTIYEDITQTIENDNRIISPPAKLYSLNQISGMVKATGRKQKKVEHSLRSLISNSFLMTKNPDEVPHKRARVKLYYHLNPSFPYHKYLLQLVSSLRRQEDNSVDNS